MSVRSVTHQQRCHKSRDGTLSIYLSIHLLSSNTCPNGPTKGDTAFCWRWQKESILPRARGGGGGGGRCQLGWVAVRGPWERPLRCERREVVHVCEEPPEVSRPTLGADMRRAQRGKRPRDVLYTGNHVNIKYSYVNIQDSWIFSPTRCSPALIWGGRRWKMIGRWDELRKLSIPTQYTFFFLAFFFFFFLHLVLFLQKMDFLICFCKHMSDIF